MTCDVPPLPRRYAGRVWRDASETPLLVELSAGEFRMGENDGDKFANDTERPSHCVRIAAGLAIGRFPVTVREFRHFRPSHAPSEPDELPVVQVNWHDAQAYCNWLTQRTERAYRLPSEAEWEFACRAGSREVFASGNEITAAEANFLHDESGTRVGPGHRTPVGSYPSNAFGIYDLHGNVCEWVEDTWHPSYIGCPDDGRAWVDSSNRHRVVRGGGWDYLPRLLRSAWRDWCPADEGADNVGFRVATDNLEDPASA
jgi:formylglycine-generating enzyme required for sulfatase activity